MGIITMKRSRASAGRLGLAAFVLVGSAAASAQTYDRAPASLPSARMMSQDSPGSESWTYAEPRSAFQRYRTVIVDPTVATPALLRPLAMGADVVVQSLSKALGGSGMAIGGALIARTDIPSRIGPDEMRADFATHVKLLPFRDHGPAMSPFNALVTLADVRTVRSRIDQWSRGAMTVAEFLAGHPKVERVQYPGLPSFPGSEISRRDLWLADGDEHGEPVNRFGPLMSFDVRGGAPAARRVFDGLGLVWRATDLGRIKSVATIPAISTHQQQGEEGRKLACVPSHQIRLSVGGEHPADLIADLDHALAKA
jgi:O-acetylhomoserine/O-acetylserine sulfhydrylase-like pyridoxal-dependent enzyme